MIRPGLCSVGFSRLKWEEVLALAVQGRLAGMEWNAAHVAPGALEVARQVRLRTEAAGLINCSYGSYYRAGVSQPEVPFERVLETAAALGAATVRIWAGNKNAEKVGADLRKRIVDDLVRVAERAAAASLEVGVEYHSNSLTNSPESAGRLMTEAAHEAIRFYWQAPPEAAAAAAIDSLRKILPRLAHLHVFNWTGRSGDYHRHPLAEALPAWGAYLREAAQAPGDRWALLEFTKDDSPRQMIEDAQALASLLPKNQP